MHSDYTMLMSVALDDEATPDELQRLREHVRTCAACAGIWERWQVVDRRFDAAPLMTPAPNFADAVMARIEARSLQRRQTRRYATGLVALVAGGFVARAGDPRGIALLGCAESRPGQQRVLRRPAGCGDCYLDLPWCPATHGGCRRADARGMGRPVGHAHVSFEHAVALGRGPRSRGDGRSGGGELSFRTDSTWEWRLPPRRRMGAPPRNSIRR